MAASPDAATPWDALFGAGEASFDDVLRELRRLFPASLLDGDGWARLLDRAAELPAAAAAYFGFEFRLGDPDPSADFCVPVALDIVVRRFIQEAAAGRRPSRAALARCITEFRRADSVLARWADGAILEYDVATLPAGSRSTPGIYFRVRREPGPSERDVQDLARRDIARVLASASGRAPDVAEQREVERAFAALPPGARIAHAGVMPDRAERAIRLVVGGVDLAAAPAFLARLRWPGRIDLATGILADLNSVGSRVILSFDVTARGPGSRLGWEMRANEKGDWEATTPSDWRPCVARLAERGWCTASKARGLLQWPGLQRMYADNAVFLAHQGINHLKVSVAGDAVDAKGYVGMAFVPLPTAEPTSPRRSTGA